MKIVHVTNYFRDIHQHVGGAEQACYRTALLTARNGWNVLIATLRPEIEGEPEFPAEYIPVVEDHIPRMTRKYLEAAKWFALQYDPLARRAFRRMLEKSDADAVHFHNCQFLTLSLLPEAKRLGLKTVASIYDYWFFCPTVMLLDASKRFCTRGHGPWCLECLPSRFRPVQSALLSIRKRVFDRYLKMVDVFHVLSRHSAQVLEGCGIEPEKIRVVPLTLPMEYRSAEDSTAAVDPNMILFAGWRNERKGLHRLLEAMPFVLEQRPDARLIAIGGEVRFGEDYEATLTSLVDSAGLGDKVDFKGHLQPSEIKDYLHRAAVVAIPEQYDNMSPLLMIEAMALEKPIVISRTGGIPEFVEHGVSGWLADPQDPKDFADKILRVLRNGDATREMGKSARRAVLEICDDDRIWEKTRGLYESPASTSERSVSS